MCHVVGGKLLQNQSSLDKSGMTLIHINKVTFRMRLTVCLSELRKCVNDITVYGRTVLRFTGIKVYIQYVPCIYIQM